MNNWRPMDTAPRDRTTPLSWVLVDHEDFIVPIFAYWDGHTWRDDLGRLVRREPRGWMPMPMRARPSQSVMADWSQEHWDNLEQQAQRIVTLLAVRDAEQANKAWRLKLKLAIMAIAGFHE